MKDEGFIKKKIINNLNASGAKKLIQLIMRPVTNHKKYRKIKKDSKRAVLHYNALVDSIKKTKKDKLRFAAYVIFDSTYGIDGVFKLMMNDKDHWAPMVVVIPDVSRGETHKRQTYLKTKQFFIDKYGSNYVLDGWNCAEDTYNNLLKRFDIVYYANPYDEMVHKYHSIEFAAKKNVLPFYVSYGYDIGKYTTLSRLRNPELNLAWKVFADTVYTYQDYKRYQLIKGKNVVLAGYSKMDVLNNFPTPKKSRIKVLISAHHTVSFDILPLSNFLKYYSLILRLPGLFPEIDFVFRPHPLLFTTLINNNIWSKEKVDKYIEALTEKGIEYSVGGDYLHLFAECDAIINDCGSFTVEWLYTGKPGCFVYNEKLKSKQLTTLMNKALSQHVIAKSERDIVDFIASLSIKRKVKNNMKQWVKDNISINYPNVSEFILREISVNK